MLTKNQEEVLKHQLEEWKYLNTYIIDMDKGYSSFFSTVLLIFTGILLVALDPGDAISTVGDGWRIISLAALPAMVLALGNLAYHFRITAILRGHLAQLELSMNEKVGEDVHLWNSYLVETHMAHNNWANKFLMVPAGILMLIVFAICYTTAYSLILGSSTIALIASWKIGTRVIIFCLYIIITLIPTVILGGTFFGNETVRKLTEDVEYIKRLYQRYRRY